MRIQIQEFISKKREQKLVKNMERTLDFEDVEIMGISENEEEEDVMQEIDHGKRKGTIQGSGISALKKSKDQQSNRGPIDTYFPPNRPFWEKV